MSDAAASDTVLTDDATATPDAGAAATVDATAPAATTVLTDDASAEPAKVELTDAQKAEAAAEAAKTAGAPEVYADFTLPENFKSDESTIGKFKEIAKELGLTQEAAQKLVEFQATQSSTNVQAFGTAMQAHVDKTANEWATAAKADPEYGGEKFNENLGIAKQALDKFGTPELKTLLKESRMGNHPEVIRMLVKAGKAISQDGFVPGRSAAAPKDAASVLYGPSSS